MFWKLGCSFRRSLQICVSTVWVAALGWYCQTSVSNSVLLISLPPWPARYTSNLVSSRVRGIAFPSGPIKLLVDRQSTNFVPSWPPVPPNALSILGCGSDTRPTAPRCRAVVFINCSQPRHALRLPPPHAQDTTNPKSTGGWMVRALRTSRDTEHVGTLQIRLVTLQGSPARGLGARGPDTASPVRPKTFRAAVVAQALCRAGSRRRAGLDVGRRGAGTASHQEHRHQDRETH